MTSRMRIGSDVSPASSKVFDSAPDRASMRIGSESSDMLSSSSPEDPELFSSIRMASVAPSRLDMLSSSSLKNPRVFSFGSVSESLEDGLRHSLSH